MSCKFWLVKIPKIKNEIVHIASCYTLSITLQKKKNAIFQVPNKKTGIRVWVCHLPFWLVFHSFSCFSFSCLQSSGNLISFQNRTEEKIKQITKRINEEMWFVNIHQWLKVKTATKLGRLSFPLALSLCHSPYVNSIYIYIYTNKQSRNIIKEHTKVSTLEIRKRAQHWTEQTCFMFVNPIQNLIKSVVIIIWHDFVLTASNWILLFW